MPSLREIRGKIKSIKSTQQITKAMKMVAAARLRRAQARIVSARPFAQKMEEMMADVVVRIDEHRAHRLFAHREGTKRALLLVTSDRGLCGAFNTNLIREALRYLGRHGAANVRLLVAGRKGRDYFRRYGIVPVKEYVGVSTAPGFVHADVITSDLADLYDRENLAGVDMLFNEFKSVIQQRVVVKGLLPLEPIPAAAEAGPRRERWPDFIYEPGREAFLEALIPRFLKAQVFRVLLESAAAELGARMSAMDSATRNAADLLESFTLRLNRTRQASITKEILEVVGGAEALK